MSSTTPPSTRPQAHRRGLFFPAMALLMLAVVVSGFWGTLYHPSAGALLATYQQVHGAVLTTWRLPFAAQALLVARGRTTWHRRLGVIGAPRAIAAIATSLQTMALMPDNWRLRGIDLVAHDLVTLRRVHRATLWGVPLFLVVHLAPAFMLPGTALDDWMLGLIP